MSLSVALLVAAALPGPAEPFVRLEAGPWRGGGWARADGGFSHCSLSRGSVEDGVVLTVDAAGTLALSMAAPGSADGPLTVAVSVGGVALGELPALASDGRIQVDLGPEHQARLEGGGALELRTPRAPLRGSLAGASGALRQLRECVALTRFFAAPCAPRPASEDGARSRTADPALDSGARERVRALLGAAGLRRIVFAPPESLGAATAELAWTSGEILGFATLEARSERSVAELESYHLGVYATGCAAPPTQRSADPIEVAGYLLYQTAVECRVREGLRVAIVTSVLDSVDVISIVHVALAHRREQLDELHRSLRTLLASLLRFSVG